MNVDQALNDRIREIVRIELDSRRISRPTVAQAIGISVHRLNHMLKPIPIEPDESKKKPTLLPPAIVEAIRIYLKLPEGWPVTALRGADTPGYLTLHEARAQYPVVAKYIEGSSVPDHIPAEFVSAGYQLLVMPDDSMMPQVHPGDILAVAPAAELKIRVGFPHVILLDGKPAVRTVEHDGRDYVLTPANPKYQTAPLGSELIGIVVGRVWIDETGERRSRLNALGLRLT